VAAAARRPGEKAATPAPERAALPPVVVVFGPTASGKTAAAVDLAELLGAEIVAADSMQLYAGFSILTNQPTAEQARRVPHHLVGVVDPSTEFSVAQYASLAHVAIDGILGRGLRVVVEGGSGLYVRAALGGLSFGPHPDPTRRAELLRRLEVDGLGGLAAELEAGDPTTAAAVDLANPRRVLRALEAVLAAGGPLDSQERAALWQPGGRYEHALVALEADRDWLRRRIDERVDWMFAHGALDEVRAARSRGPLSSTLRQAIGVRELGDHLDGLLGLEEAAAQTKARTRRLVRRQATWMRKLPAAARIAVTGRPPRAVAGEILARLAGGTP
jgi:tRNA dimethylallyltransferase